MAIACKKALKIVEKVAIIDFDNHHGNGTQDIFLDHPNVLFVSLHKYPDYPGTGKISEKNCLNYPLPGGTTEREYIKTFKDSKFFSKMTRLFQTTVSEETIGAMTSS